MFSSDGQLLPIDRMPETARRAIKALKIRGVRQEDGAMAELQIAEIQMWDKLAALHHIGEHLGMYKQIHEHHWADQLRQMTDEELEAEERRLDAEIERAMRERDAGVPLSS